jgi:competence transcription factor ComK
MLDNEGNTAAQRPLKCALSFVETIVVHIRLHLTETTFEKQSFFYFKTQRKNGSKVPAPKSNILISGGGE